MPWLSIIGDWASIAGLFVSAFALAFAKAAKQAAKDARTEVRKANAVEVLARISDTANSLQASLENNHKIELIVRARDLMSDLNHFKLRYERFLDSSSKVRLDVARSEIGIIRETVSIKGMPNNDVEKSRMLKTWRQYVVEILNEESAKIKAVIEREQE